MHAWVAAVPQTWNAVPNARDAIHGAQFDPAQTTFPTVVYRRYTKGWRKPVALPYEHGAGVGRIPGPLIRARVGDELRIHFKNLDTLHDQPHSMHFHGVEYEPSSDGVWLPLFSGKGGNVKPGQSFTYELTAGPGSAGVWPYHDHSASMEDSLAGGMFGALSIAGRRERRADREYVVAFAPWHGFQTINGRAFVGNTPVFTARVGETVQWDVFAIGDEFHTFHVHGHRWRTDAGHAGGHARARPGRVVPRALARGRARHVALPLPRRVAHDPGHDRPLQGAAVKRLLAPLALAVALAAPATAAAEDVTVRMPGKFFEPARLTTVAGDRVTFKNNDLADARRADRRRRLRLRARSRASRTGRRRSTSRASTPSSARCTRS